MFLFEHVNPLIFLISLSIGIFLTYIFVPPTRVVMVHPTPYNAEKIIYKDDAGVCYRYKVQEVHCPYDENKIKPIPLSSSIKK